MSDSKTNVLIGLDNFPNYTEIHPEYVYLTIPAKYVCVYHKLLILVANFGKDIVNDCNASCKTNNKYIITCWNLFQSAIGCYHLNRIEEADFFIKYIEEQLNNVYKGSELPECNGIFDIRIDPNGEVRAIVTCGEIPHFYVDEENGELYQSVTNNKIYVDEDNVES